jgi:hypothetical protein
LLVNGTPANGNYDFEFRLFDALSGGTQQGLTTGANNVVVTDGTFTVTLNFIVCPNCFNGDPRFLDITVRASGGGPFTPLMPRQPITATPYALKIPYLTINGPFNFGGTILNTTNTFVGEFAGASTAPASNPASSAGKFNSFFGSSAGGSNTTGAINAFFGTQAGGDNTTGGGNAFFGYFAGAFNNANANSFFGAGAGRVNTSGSQNAFFGAAAGESNFAGSQNTIIGANADLPGVPSTLTNATAIGANALVTQSNSLVLGSINGVNEATASTNVGIGVTAPLDRLHVNGIIRVDVLGVDGIKPLCLNASNQVSTCSAVSLNKAAMQPTTGDLVNAIKEQRAQIDTQQKEIAALKKLICLDHPEAEMCKP